MHSDVIQRAVRRKKANVYRRASTHKQAKDSYKHQLQCIQAHYPEFTISNSTNVNVKETISGRSDMEVRVVTGLGRCLRHLVHNPSEILLVSSDDRIARRADVFELLQDLGLGHRIYDASTGMNVNDIIKAGRHHDIEEQSDKKYDAQIASMERRQADGETLGSSDIAKHSKKGSKTKTRLADEREAHVLSIVANMTRHGGGQKPSYAAISDELNRQGVGTGQNHLWTPARLCQLRKRSPEKWDYAFDSYHRPRRRIRKLVIEALTEIQNKRKHRRRRLWLSNTTILDALLHGITWRDFRSQIVSPKKLNDQILTQGGDDGCRGPPALLSPVLHLLKQAMVRLTRLCRQPSVQCRH
mmetsp:Transcript_322/g.901  ORF Transcript_322/g.901 Transcript_322/m.901 type:complete len:356 (+) Transcript_322:618-1685(+)